MQPRNNSRRGDESAKSDGGGEFRHSDNEALVVLAPVNDQLVTVWRQSHVPTPSSSTRRMVSVPPNRLTRSNPSRAIWLPVHVAPLPRLRRAPFASGIMGGLDIARGCSPNERPVNSFKRLFSAAPEGTTALFFIQIFSTLGFAVLYSTLVLYATKHLQLPVKVATTLMGVFGAFNY